MNQSKISQANMTRGVQHDVVGLQISVNDAVGMQMLESKNDLPGTI